MLIDTFNSIKSFLKIHNQHRLTNYQVNTACGLDIYFKCETCGTCKKVDEVIYNKLEI